MTEMATTYPAGRPRATQAILWAGAAAGVLDILAAFVNSGVRGTGPAVVLKAVASGLLGRAAFQGGSTAAALGLFLHFVIATGWAAIYYIASRAFPVMVRRPVVSGILYGAMVRWLMQFVVVPLSGAPSFRGSTGALAFLVPLGIHILFVGLPIALVISGFARREGPAGDQ